MLETVGIVMGFVALAYAGWRWGHDSVDGIESPEWARRHSWYARPAGSYGNSGPRPTIPPRPLARDERTLGRGGGLGHREIAA